MSNPRPDLALLPPPAPRRDLRAADAAEGWNRYYDTLASWQAADLRARTLAARLHTVEQERGDLTARVAALVTLCLCGWVAAAVALVIFALHLLVR